MSAPPAASSPVLGQRLCLALHRAARAMDAAYRPQLDALGLTYTQHLVLVALLEGPTSGVRQIGDQLGLASSTLSPVLDRLTRMGLVERRRATTDERRVEVVMTSAGHDLAHRANAVSADVSAATGLDDAGQLALVEELHDLITTLGGTPTQ